MTKFVLALAASLATVVIQVPEWGDITLIEALWDLLGAIGLMVTVGRLASIQRDRKLFHGGRINTLVPDPTRRRAMLVLWRSLRRREAARVVQMSAIGVLGVWASLQPSLIKPSVITPTGLIITGILFIVVLATIVQSINDSRAAREVTDLFIESEVE